MIKIRNLPALLAIAGVLVLPGCNPGRQASRASYPSQAYPSPQSPELTQGVIRQAQELLQQQGIYHGRIDGVWGPRTASAVRSYQQQQYLNATGKLDVDTLSSLNLGTNPNYGVQKQGDQRYGSTANLPLDTSSQPDSRSAR